MTELIYHNKQNDAIKGDKIILEARKIKISTKPIKGSHAHKANRAEGRHNAIAWVDIEIFPTGQFKLEE